jgi:hypothetical protein
MSEEAELPYAHCSTVGELLDAPSLKLSSLPEWARFTRECEVVDACLNRHELRQRPGMHELRRAVRGMLLALDGPEKDRELVKFFHSFGSLKVDCRRLIRRMLLDSLVPRHLTRVGGLRRMSRGVQDCAATTMLCLKQLGLNRDVAFLIVKWTIWMQSDSTRCVAVARDVDLSDEKRFDDVLQAVANRLFWPKEATLSEFNAFAAMVGWKPNEMAPEWAFDLERTLRVQTRDSYLLCSAQDGVWRLIVSFEQDYDVEGEPAEEYCVLLLPGGTYAMERLEDMHVCPAYSTLFRAVVNLWHYFYCVTARGAHVRLSKMVEGAEVVVEGVKLCEVQSREVAAFRYRISEEPLLRGAGGIASLPGAVGGKRERAVRIRDSARAGEALPPRVDVDAERHQSGG